ncbi:hypothetical protein [Lentibacillus sp. CBA3610]|uniref:hypothetical protein n=1 Tax=Lentibacillus sp. CBA3610 TaxID=2518176 RepID=UPI00159562E5|nr:hypothetical protein [Lentibacillus sp. CBA3610]QKY68359.1 hypothetical protein Len3610_00845 [Lentibacillus sp. CBA3610]
MRIILELLRIILIFALFGGLLWLILNNIYDGIAAEQYQWIGGLGIYVFLFILYRNRWQFSGWYTGEGRQKLPKKAVQTLSATALLLLAIPFILSMID